jgi:hypothetical protein
VLTKQYIIFYVKNYKNKLRKSSKSFLILISIRDAWFNINGPATRSRSARSLDLLASSKLQPVAKSLTSTEAGMDSNYLAPIYIKGLEICTTVP